MTMATRCPACGTVFRVVQDQLRVSAGWVRCGRCAEAFDAAASLIDLDGPPAGARPPPASAGEGSAAATEAVTATTTGDRSLGEGEGDGPGTSPATSPAAADGAQVAEARACDAVVAAGADDVPAATPSPNAETAETLVAGEPGAIPPTPAVAEADAEADAAADADADDATAAPLVSPAPPLASPAATLTEPAPPPVAPTETESARDDRDGRPSVPPREHDALAAPANVGAGHDAAVAPSFLRRAERDERWRRPKVRAALATGVVAAALGLVAQAAVLHGDWVAAKVPAVRPWLARACVWLGCNVGEYRQIEALSVESSGLVRVEGTSLYRLSVVLRNRAALEIAAPSIDLALTDAQGQLIARRVLALTELGAPLPVLKPGAEFPVQASLSVGEQAVSGYTVEIFYP